MQMLGNRMKEYEAVACYRLTQKVPVIIRVDGRAFHTYTRQFNKPFSQLLRDVMVNSMRYTADEMTGFKLAYHQSDEVSFLITDMDNLDTQAWFGNKLQKLASVTASIFTAAFIECMSDQTLPFKPGRVSFDARAFNVPVDDVPNYFVWRQRDWERNSLNMFAQSFFSHKELIGRSQTDVHNMLHGIGENWADLDAWWKNGSYHIKGENVVESNVWPTYEQIKGLIERVKV